jgi:hypothetical protein
MERGSRNDPTFPIFLVLSTVFFFVFVYATFPRRDAPPPSSRAVNGRIPAPESKPMEASGRKRTRWPDPMRNVALRLR